MAFTGKQGWLFKQGGKRKNWKQRYFVLSSGTFAYYSSKGVRAVCVFTACEAPESMCSLAHSIPHSAPVGQASGRSEAKEHAGVLPRAR